MAKGFDLGWDNLPAFIGNGSGKSIQSEASAEIKQQAAAEADTASKTKGAEQWELTLQTPMGPQVMIAQINRSGDSFAGTISSGEMAAQEITGKISGNTLTWTLSITKPMSIKLSFEAKVDGDEMTGIVKFGMFGKAALAGKRI